MLTGGFQTPGDLAHPTRLLESISKPSRPTQSADATAAEGNNNDDNLHLLLPATGGDVDLCKTLLTANVLGYPTPGLLAWNETYSHPNQMAGGSHLAKVFRVLDYLEALKPSQDSDLVLMVDAYDIWFQLRPDIMIERFHAINKVADERNSRRMGSAIPVKEFEQKVIFGAGKRCAPNQLHTMACYAIPESPLPADLYGGDTDTVVGRNKYTSHRQRYLNSGYIIGRVSDVRKLFRAAADEIKNTPDHIEKMDNGSGGSDFLYHGSDQSIFNTLMGRQEYHREAIRRAHGTQIASSTGRRQAKSNRKRRRTATESPDASALKIEGTYVSDPLNPSFTHETPEASFDPLDQRHEFGIGLDYFSDLGHQTVNAETDAKWLRFDTTPLDTDFPRRNRFDCAPRVHKSSALADITRTKAPFADVAPSTSSGGSRGDEQQQAATWETIPLYTNLCLGRVPVIVHHNGDKAARGYSWDDMWFQSRSREMLQARFATQNKDEDGEIKQNIDGTIAWTDKGDSLSWNGLCGAYNDQLW